MNSFLSMLRKKTIVLSFLLPFIISFFIHQSRENYFFISYMDMYFFHFSLLIPFSSLQIRQMTSLMLANFKNAASQLDAWVTLKRESWQIITPTTILLKEFVVHVNTSNVYMLKLDRYYMLKSIYPFKTYPDQSEVPSTPRISILTIALLEYQLPWLIQVPYTIDPCSSFSV